MRNLPVEAVRSGIQKSATHSPPAGGLAFVTIAADPLEFWEFKQIYCSYDTALASTGLLTAYVNDVTVWTVNVPRSGTYVFTFVRGLYVGAKNQNIRAILSQRSGVKGTITIIYR